MAEYRCTNCGYVTVAGAVPEACPVCKHKKTFENVTIPSPSTSINTADAVAILMFREHICYL